MDYCEFSCDLERISLENKDILTAYLSEIGFESFYEEDNLFKAYIQKDLYSEQVLQSAMDSAKTFIGDIPYSVQLILSQNWNTEWESTFESVEVSDSILIRIPQYKPIKSFKYEIVIKPEMSFGSGTHETTSQILQEMYSIDFSGKTVADCGCGTGILGIFASLLGAKQVFAFDYDDCCVSNTLTNMQLNSVANMEVKLAKLDALYNKKFDVVIANINRNILIENMQFIANAVNTNGLVVLSGFYTEDVADIKMAAEQFGLELQSTKSKNNWTITTFINK
ncbi:MAG: 50S ribosomal protein L11 methyltransferase [Bacteroidales bacterium]|nr:50S ribosomal protein L11 methyltransferase [Bacteroidales bacterium]